MRYRHVWPGFLLLAALGFLLVGLVRWGDHFLSPGPTGGIHGLLQLWAASRPLDESTAAPRIPAAPGSASDAPASPPAPTPPLSGGPPSAPGQTPPADAPLASPPVAAAAPTSTPESKAPAPERVAEPREAAPAPTAPPPARYALALGTFAVSEDAEQVEAKLNQAGFSTVRFRQQAPTKLFSVHVAALKDPEEGQATVERLQKEGYPPSVLLVGRNGVTVRVGEPTPLRTAVQLAEKLRGAGYDARVSTESARAGQVSLRHGNFASRPEADAASREIARFGVPNEVIQVR